MMAVTPSQNISLPCYPPPRESLLLRLRFVDRYLLLRKKSHQSGLSLVEVLVSLSVLALIGIVATSSLQQAIRLSDAIEARSQKLQQLQSLQTLLRSDIESSIHIYYPEQHPAENALNYPLWYEAELSSNNIVLSGRQARPYIGDGGTNHLIIEDFFYSFEQSQLVRHYKRQATSPWVESIIPMEFQSFSVARVIADKNEVSARKEKNSTPEKLPTDTSQAKMLVIKWASKHYGEMALWVLEP